MKHVFGKIVRARRVAARMTLETLAARIKSVKGYLSGVENGKVSPPAPAFVHEIAIALGLPECKMQLLAWLAKAPAAVHGTAEYKDLCARVLAMRED